MPNISALINAIFTGLKLFIPLLILLKFSKIFSNKIDINILVTATNWMLLLAGTLYLLLVASDIFIAYYSQSEYEQFRVSNRIFGPYWFAFAIEGFIYILLPQMVWIKKVQISIIATIVWSLFAYALAALVFYSEHSGHIISSFGYSEPLLTYFKSLIIFIALLAIVYFMLLKRKRHLVSKQQA
ncbi:MAG: hypothetical protein JWQ57_3289 [Mucilaginibacter sp.]|nr:hypothetical protein [Mucilaginibacter sp.]